MGASARIPPGGLGALRVICGLFLLAWALPTVPWLGAAAPAFFDPPPLSLAGLVSGFPSATFIAVTNGAIIVLTCLMLLGIRARISTIALCVLAVSLRSFKYSFGKIDHDIMLWVLLGCMAFSGWGRTLALWPDKPSRFDAPGRAGALVAVALAFGMLTAGSGKAMVWLDFDLTRNGYLAWFYFGFFNLGRHHLLAPLVFSFPIWLAELFDYTAVVFENTGFVWLLLGPTAWRIWLLTAATFHLSNALLLNIPFEVHFPLLLAFTDLSNVEAALEGWLRSTTGRVAAALLVTGLLVIGFVSNWRPIWTVFAGRDVESLSRTELYASVLLWTVAILALAKSVVAMRRQERPRPSRASDLPVYDAAADGIPPAVTTRQGIRAAH